ncbi:MAG: hypothetical protein QOF19_289 [Alphaproteobacteria bacterium]|jgi:hypothetical protein|nr:hypothetical protein [Alphaproteobacteria bacterium]
MERQPKETLYAYLERRERELTHEIAALQGEIAPREEELAHVRSAKRIVDKLGGDNAAHFSRPEQSLVVEDVTAQTVAGKIEAKAAPNETTKRPTLEAFADGVLDLTEGMERISRAFIEAGERRPFLQFEHLTIKQLIIKAFTDRFTDGATASELRDFIRDAYGRDIERASLTPQLSRLKEERVVEYLRHPESDQGGVEDDPSKFVVVKPFNSSTRRFRVGSVFEIPTDEDQLRTFKLELEPLDLEHLKARRFIVPRIDAGGPWRLAQPMKLIEGKTE